ncbi:phosphotransferase [Bacillus sp. RG28]|uniref:Phosphotransferase n=1 Tax=Gottfriedia endophytica TaxID=2820819 RepID=A0A940NH91_9BACI|nr:phosphotransferase [Gottfriedia endophytica]MBP0724240.1 phosphotransferase [Gottfriedia endophytica]
MNVWEPEVEINEKNARIIICDQFPNLCQFQIKKIGQGFDNTIFSLEEKYLFRFPRREVAAQLLEKEKNLLLVVGSDLPISTTIPLFLGEPTEKFNWPFIGYSFIKGKVPSELSKIERIEMAEPLANFLKKLHSISVKKMEEIGIPRDHIRRLDLSYRVPKLRKNLVKVFEHNLFQHKDLLEQYINEIKYINLQSKDVLVHGDLHYRNMILNEENKLAGIIDWGDAHLGKRAIDLSIVYSLIPKEARNEFYSIYGEVDEEEKYIAQFKAIYTTILLLLYGFDSNDVSLVKISQENLLIALIH